MKKVIFIVLSVFIVIITMVFVGIRFKDDNDKMFVRSGYVLNNEKNSGNKTDSTNTVKYYFNEETNYNNSYDNHVEFKDTNGNKVKVADTSFVHYNDDSISLLKKGVIFNLDEIGNKIPKYYNLFEGTVLEYKNGNYVVDNLGKQLKFKNFIVKTSKDKYLIVSNSIKLKLDGETESSVKSNYIEISYVDEDVIRIENQESIYQTISDMATVEIGDDISLNLSNGYFFYKGEGKINLQQITIDSDDNIDITPLEEEKKEEEESEENNEQNSATSGNNGDGNGETENPEDSVSNSVTLEEEVDEDSLVLPTASITDMIVTANKVDCTIVIEDKSNIVTGSSYTTLVENSTGKVVWAKEEAEGTYNISVFSETLVPNTTYSLTTTISYMKNELEYTMDVIQQIFVTETVGVNIEKDYFSSDTLSFKVSIDSYSSAKSAIVSLIDTKGEVVSTYPISAEQAQSEEGQIIAFENLDANTKYSVRVDNIFYDNDILADDFSMEMSAKTLKKRPTIGAVNFDIDKKNSLFTLKLNGMEDPNNGAESYKFEIYDARTLASGGAPITSIEKSSLTSVDLAIDNVNILRGIPYVFRVVIEFYDNEKYIEYYSSYSNNMQMDGVESPSISWKSDNVTFESITGTITVNDPRNTIDYSKNMTIVYTNSIGTTLSYTAQGNTIIPFSRNNLRANETYTISVYATVDLQDGNAAVDMYHVGSVTVLTEPTSPFEMSMTHLTDDVSTSFTIQARISPTAGVDTDLEASTLTGVTFYLYEGKTAAGTPLVTAKKVDRDLREYYSDLKENYYDNSFLINPSFFGKTASDLTSDYYTIAVDSAYDYTDFKNNIPINNNVITVKSNGYTPDPPADVDNAVDYEYIYNKDAGEHYDPNLNATTIVGVRVKAKYDNARRYAVVINYHCYDAVTMEKVDAGDKTFTVGADGIIDYVTYWFGTGTSQATVDKSLVRGHRYFFTYDASLDLDKDGTAETRYPQDPNTLYKSEILSIKKQRPTIYMYPSLSSTSSLKVKYALKDYDHALYENKLFAEESLDGINYQLVNSQFIGTTEDLNTFKTVRFTDLYAGYLNIYSKIKLIKDVNEEPTITNYLSQKFLVGSSLGKIDYDIETQVNRINIIIQNYESNRQQVDRITALKVTFGCEGKNVVEDFVKLDGNIATVDTFGLSEFVGKEVTIDVEAYYDTNIFGFDVTSDYVGLQTVYNTASSVGEYISINDLDRVVFSTEGASASIFDRSLKNNTYTLTNKLSGYSLDFSSKADADGIKYDYNPVLFKEIALATIIPVGASSFTLTQIVPGITLKENSDSYNISPSITSVEFKASIKGFSSKSNIKDDKIYVKFSTTDDGMNLIHFKTCEFNLADFSNIISVDGLTPKQTYAMEFFAYISNSAGEYNYSKLYDLDDNTENPIYYFRTNSSLVFTETSARYIANSYNDKYIYFRYDIDKVTGYDYLSFKMYKMVNNEELGNSEYQLIDVDIADEYSLKKSMSLRVPCNPGSVFEFGQIYRLEITANVVSNINGETRVIELDNPGQIDFKLNKLASPYIGISSSVSTNGVEDGNSINYRVNFYDKDKVVVDGQYTVRIVNKSNGRDVTPAKYQGYLFSIKNYNTQFTIDNVEVGSTYSLYVYYSIDMNNDVVSSVDKYNSRDAVAYSSNDVNVGTITATANTLLPNRIDLQFRNSYRLTEITKYMYSIYNSLDGSSIDSNGYVDFNPDRYTVGDVTYYLLTMPETLSASGYYYVQVQFLNRNYDVLADSTVEYIYDVKE